jgi:hypothetical protein
MAEEDEGDGNPSPRAEKLEQQHDTLMHKLHFLRFVSKIRDQDSPERSNFPVSSVAAPKPEIGEICICGEITSGEWKGWWHSDLKASQSKNEL